MYKNTIKPTKTAGSMDYYRINKFVKIRSKKDYCFFRTTAERAGM